MSQKWNRTYPLHWFDVFLSWIITPFSRARKIEDYATNGYYLMGICLVAVGFFFLWEFELLGTILSRFPASLRNILATPFSAIGWRLLPELISWIVLAAIPYLILYFIKQFRLFIGEKFANFFFGTINAGITAGEWCLEHRWSSLFIVIVLAGYITWGTFYFFEARSRNARLEWEARGKNNQLNDKFERWLYQVDYFCANISAKRDNNDKYEKEVVPFWDDKFSLITGLPRHHPAFTLRKMLQTRFSKTKGNESNLSDKEYEKAQREELRKSFEEYTPPKPVDMIPTEQQSWAWMNILLARMYATDCDENKVHSSCTSAKEHFGRVLELDSSDYSKNYQAVAHNGRGVIYGRAVRPLARDPNAEAHLTCSDAVTCANNALKEYEAAGASSGCSFVEVRTQNNIIDLLLKVGFYYEKLEKQSIELSKVCDTKAKDKAGLATCIEARVKKLMDCTKTNDFIPIAYVTAAQAYGLITTLRLASDSKADVRQETEAAGNYLRLAKIQLKEDTIFKEDFSYFQPFLIDNESQCLSPNEKEPLKGDRRCLFWHALSSGFDKSFPLTFKQVKDRITYNLNNPQ